MAGPVLPHMSAWCQRWRHRRHSWVHRRDGGFDARRYRVADLPESDARSFVEAHHCARSWPAARHRFGLVDRETDAVCGVLVLGVPMHPKVLTGPFPHLEPYVESLDLS